MQKAVISKKDYKNKFKEFDKAYIDGTTPDNETLNGSNANYELYPPRNQNKVIVIYFKRLIAK